MGGERVAGGSRDHAPLRLPGGGLLVRCGAAPPPAHADPGHRGGWWGGGRSGPACRPASARCPAARLPRAAGSGCAGRRPTPTRPAVGEGRGVVMARTSWQGGGQLRMAGRVAAMAAQGALIGQQALLGPAGDGLGGDLEDGGDFGRPQEGCGARRTPSRLAVHRDLTRCSGVPGARHRPRPRLLRCWFSRPARVSTGHGSLLSATAGREAQSPVRRLCSNVCSVEDARGTRRISAPPRAPLGLIQVSSAW